jgi:hypothetical protein
LPVQLAPRDQTLSATTLSWFTFTKGEPFMPTSSTCFLRQPERTRFEGSMPRDDCALPVIVDNQPIGLLLEAGQGFRFVAADPAFRLLDGSRFFRLEQVQRAAGAMKRALAERGPGARITSRPR